MRQYDDGNGMAKGFFIGLLTGGVVGAILALLYAPKPGKELRADIKNKADEIMDETEEYLHNAQSKAVEIINEGKKRSESLINDAKKKAETLLSDAEKIVAEAKHRAEDVRSKTTK